MTGKDIADVLTFRSFRPEPDDPSAAWKKRFPGQRTLFFGISKQTVSFRSTNKAGRFSTPESLRDVKDLKESLGSGAQTMLSHSDGGWCAISLHTRYVLSLETNLSRRPGSEEIVKTNPRTVLGGRYERGKRYALTHNPETNSSILLTLDEEYVARVESSFKENGFNLGRICCGTYVLLQHALGTVNVSKGNEKAASAFFVVLCEGAVCALVQHEDKWLELRSRTDVFEGQDFSPALELVSPFQARIAPEMPVILIADSVYPGLADAASHAFQGHSVQDLSQPDLLWNLILQN